MVLIKVIIHSELLNIFPKPKQTSLSPKRLFLLLVVYSYLNFSVVTLIPSSTPKSPSTHVYLKYISLIIYILNSVIRSTLLRYISTQSGPRYVGSTFVFFGEIQKSLFSIFLIFGQEGNILIGLKKVIRVFVKEPYVTIKICVIGLVYIIQNNLNLYAVSKLDIPTYAVN